MKRYFVLTRCLLDSIEARVHIDKKAYHIAFFNCMSMHYQSASPKVLVLAWCLYLVTILHTEHVVFSLSLL